MANIQDYAQPQNSQERRIDGSLGGIVAQQSFAQTHITVPMTADNWRRLSRETQMRVLEELGIVKITDAK